jgi:DNA-binding CsgD family transcriptional regulator
VSHEPRGIRPPTEVTAERERRAWELRVKGLTQGQIADQLDISQQGVSEILRRVEKRVLAELSASVAELKARQTAQLEYVYREAIAAWERSLRNAKSVETTTEPAKSDDPAVGVDGGSKAGPTTTRTKRTVKGQSGNPALLAQALAALADIRAIWGAEAPRKLATDIQSDGRPIGLLSNAVIVTATRGDDNGQQPARIDLDGHSEGPQVAG